MDFETLRIETEPPIGALVLDRPERLNALGATMMREITEAAHELDRHLDVRVVVLRGEGRAFSAGADLKDASTTDASDDVDWQVRREVGQRGLRMIDALEQMRAITIAQVHGYAIGGGLLLMCACDLRVAAEDTVFSIPEIDLGIPLAWGGIPRLVREIGPALTKELVMTCRRFGPRELEPLGVLNRIVPAERLEATVDELARTLVAKPGGPLVVTKDHVNAVARQMAGQTAFADGDALLGALRDPGSAEARRRYLEAVFGGEPSSE